MRRVQVQPDGCWIWTGYVDKKTGYGLLWYEGKTRLAHRLAAALAGMPVETGVVDHECHNRSDCPGGLCSHRLCVNPDHFMVKGRAANVRASATSNISRNLAKTRCPRGHKYTHTDKRGWRKCRHCERLLAEEKRRGRGAAVRKRRAHPPVLE